MCLRCTAATAAAKAADAVVLVIGIDQSQESEGHDRTNVTLPGYQNDLIAAVAGNATGPVIVVVMAGGPLDISVPKSLSTTPSILFVGYPGQAGGQAIADVIFGTYPPAGRLPYTMYPGVFTSQVSMFDHGDGDERGQRGERLRGVTFRGEHCHVQL